MKVALGVHGRFYAFDAASALLGIGADVRLFTNYPRRVVESFGFPKEDTESFIAHALLARSLNRLFRGELPDPLEAAVKRTFGAWLARRIERCACDVAFCWSGVAEETFEHVRIVRSLNRSSLHIEAQRALLAEESDRVGVRIEQPSQWIVDREKREYTLADSIIVPSHGALRSFEHTPHASKVVRIPLTASSRRWRASQEVVAERLRRIRSGEPLRVLSVGLVSYQKGMHDTAAVVRELHDKVRFRFTGAIMPECRPLVDGLHHLAEFEGHIPERVLPNAYAWADIVLLPSVQDGFPVVLAHAQAAAVPFIATPHTGGPDLLEMGGRGWIVPIRSPEAIVERIMSLDANRHELADAVYHLDTQPLNRTWTDVAREMLTHWQALRPEN